MVSSGSGGDQPRAAHVTASRTKDGREISSLIDRLVFTGTCSELGVPHSLVTVELGDRGGQTEIALHHQLPDDPTILREHEGGWNGCLDSLVCCFATG